MRFESIRIENFRAISRFQAENLASMVLIAGPNGCGKSSIFDAIRLLKSVYGGYQQDEWRNWFGEFQINLANRGELARLFQHRDAPVEVEAVLSLADPEVEYLRENASVVLEPLAWQQLVGRAVDMRTFGAPALATELRVYGAEVRRIVEATVPALQAALEAATFTARLSISPDLQIQVEPSQVLEIVFQTYDPQHLGVVEYHGPARAYEREPAGGVTLNLQTFEEQRRQQSLYNWREKYKNVKTELTSNYVRELIAEQAGVVLEGAQNLNTTLSELFQTFFPDKTYDGPRPTPEGTPEFPVRLATGETHDIDDLSSGEKEVLYGYLRLRNSAPHHSVILLDEPELHLNPVLLQGLPDFYQRHLARALNNQLWLVTHSDALLRQAVGNPNFSVYHMRVAGLTAADDNQALPVTAESELERAVIDLVGDLATYKPYAKVVVLEGGGSDVDVTIVSRLFPQFAQSVNLISGGNRKRVQDLYDLLSATDATAALAMRFFAIVDRDTGAPETPDATRVLQWDRYHIENYLLEPRYVLAALTATAMNPDLNSEEEVFDALRRAAETVVNRLVLQELQREANDGLVAAISVGASPATAAPARELRPSIEASAGRVKDAAASLLAEGHLEARQQHYEAELTAALDGGEWVARFPGRLILSRFVDRHVSGVSYEAFRNLIMDQMVDDAYQPPGMGAVIASILAAPLTR